MEDPQDRVSGARLEQGAAEDVGIIAKGGAVQVVGQVAQRTLSFIFTFVALRLVGQRGYGLYRQVAQILSIAGQLGLAGFNYASMRWIARARAGGDPGGVRGAARVGLRGVTIASVLVLAALIVTAPAIAAPFGDNANEDAQLAYLLRVGALYVPLFAMMQVLRYCTQGYKTMVPSVMTGNVIQPAARFLTGVAVLLVGYFMLELPSGTLVTTAVVTLVLSAAVGAVAGAFYLRRMLTPAERAATAVTQTRAMTRFALPQMGASLLGVQTLGLGILVLGALSSTTEVALFGVALSLQGPGNVFLGGIVNIWAPVVSDLHERGEIARLGSLYQTINRWIATFSFPVFAALIIVPDLFVRLFAGSEGAGAAPVVAILAVGNIFYTGTGPTGYVISMTGRPGVNFANSIVAVGLYVTLGVLIVPEHGALGMAVVDAVVTALVNSARVVEAKILVGIQPFGRSFLKPVIATLAGAAVLLAVRVPGGSAVAIELAGVIAGAVVYFVVLRVLGIDEEERHVFDRIRRRALSRNRRP